MAEGKKSVHTTPNSKAKKDKTEHKIHNADGKIKESDSYGNDEFPPIG